MILNANFLSLFCIGIAVDGFFPNQLFQLFLDLTGASRPEAVHTCIIYFRPGSLLEIKPIYYIRTYPKKFAFFSMFINNDTMS